MSLIIDNHHIDIVKPLEFCCFICILCCVMHYSCFMPCWIVSYAVHNDHRQDLLVVLGVYIVSGSLHILWTLYT